MNCLLKNNCDMSWGTKDMIHHSSRQNNHNFKSNIRQVGHWLRNSLGTPAAAARCRRPCVIFFYDRDV